MRSAICSCTVFSGDGFHIIVDPSLKDKEAMATELDQMNFTGLALAADNWLRKPTLATVSNQPTEACCPS